MQRCEVDLPHPRQQMIAQSDTVVQVYANYTISERFEPVIGTMESEIGQNLSVPRVVPESYVDLIVLAQQQPKLVRRWDLEGVAAVLEAQLHA